MKHVLMNDEPGEAGGGGAAPAEESNWYDSLPQDMREDQNITKFESVETMAKSWQNAQRLIGQDKIPMPQTDEDWSNTYARLGRPDESTGYEVAAPDGVEVNAEQQGHFFEVAHQLGLSQKQVEGLAAYDFQRSSTASESATAANESATNQALDSLKDEWGDAYDQKVGIANRAVEEFMGENDLAFMRETSINGVKLADHPVMVKLLSNIGDGMMESGKLEGVGSEQAKTPQEVEDERNTLMAHPAYIDNRHPEHKQILRRVQQSFEQQYQK